MHPPLARLLLAAHAFGLLLLAPTARGAQLEPLSHTSTVLRDNPLGDPAQRRIAALLPDRSDATTPLPMVIYLPGWGGSSEDTIAQGTSGWLARTVDTLAAAGRPVRIAVVDGRSRYGGSQFLNSTATGRYADYVCEEVAPLLTQRYKTSQLLLAGHSSGAYGALLLASRNQKQFTAVAALSPDSDFEVTHRPLVQQARSLTPAEVEAASAPAPKFRMPSNGLGTLILGLCANYAPIPSQPGRFEWLYDAKGQWRPEAWQRWLDLDPLTIVRKNPDAFSPAQRIYLDGAEHDEFGANIGARKIHAVLRERKAPVEFHEPPGHHSDRLSERLVRGLQWIFSH